MSITLTGTGGLFTRLGKIGALLNAVNNFIGTAPVPVTTLTGNGTTATATTLYAHGYTTGDTILIAGASPSGFNGSQTITVTSTTQFTYANSTNATATGTITATKTAGVGYFAVGPYTDNIAAQFNSTDQNLLTSLYSQRDSYRTVHSTFESFLQSLAQSVLIQMANEDTPLSAQTVSQAMSLLISQMTANAQTVQKPTVSVAVAAGSSNVGTGTLVASTLSSKGVQLDYVFPETITATCSSDGQGSGTAGQETFTITSPVAQTTETAWNWPLGSGISTSLNAVDATVDAASGNQLQNGSFKTWTNPSVGPDNWLVLTGTVGTQINQASGANVYKGSSGLDILGDGSTLTAITQPFNVATSTAGNAGGSPLTLSANTQYAVNFALKMSSVPAAGVLVVELTDGSNAVVNDANGVANSISVALTGATTSFVLHSGFFRTPLVNPTTGYRLRVRLTTALSNTVHCYFGHLALTSATSLYSGGPAVGLFSGATNFVLSDTFSAVVSNDMKGRWQKLAEQLFGMRTLGLQLPSGNSPTVADSLIA